MKKWLGLILAGLFTISCAACGGGSADQADIKDTEASGSKALVVYFSRSGEQYDVGTVEKGNTQLLAEEIAAQTGADLFAIEPAVDDYPDNLEEMQVRAGEERDAGARPEIRSQIENFDSYDTVYVGYPIWVNDMPMIVYTFLESYDWTGKTIAPFCTYRVSGLADTEAAIREICTGAKLLPGLAVPGETAQNDAEGTWQAVAEWLEGAGQE